MSHTILIVDDSATTRAIIKRTLGMIGFDASTDTTVLEGASGKAGLDTLRERGGRVDLVLADLHMPEMGGVEMTRHMRADAALRDIPVVVISAEPNVARLEELRAAGVTYILVTISGGADQLRRFAREIMPAFADAPAARAAE